MALKLRYLSSSVGVLAAVLSGCADNSTSPVSIEYSQIGFCNTYRTPGGVRASKPHEVYVVYKIEAVDNAKRNADFTFFPTRLYVDPAEWGANQKPWAAKPGQMQDFFAQRDNRRFFSNDASFTQAMGLPALEPGVISQGVKKTISGYAIVAVPTSGEDRPVEHSFKLSYEPQAGDAVDPPVALNTMNAGQTSWPHPDACQELAFEKSRS